MALFSFLKVSYIVLKQQKTFAAAKVLLFFDMCNLLAPFFANLIKKHLVSEVLLFQNYKELKAEN